MGILAYSAAAVLDKKWAVAKGCWDGNIKNAANFNNPAPGHEPLQNIANGTGNEMREAAAWMLAENIMSLNPKFKIEVRHVEWKDYLVQYRNYMYPIFITGWAAD